MNDSMSSLWFAIKIYRKLNTSLQQKVDDLVNNSTEEVRAKTPEERKEHLDRFCSREDRERFLFAIENKKIIGRVIILKRNIKFSSKNISLGGIGGVLVRDSRRRMGVATALLEQARQELRNINCDIAYLCANITKPYIVKMYGKVGFRLLDRPQTYLGKSGKRYTDKDAMVAPVNSKEIFSEVMKGTQPLDIGIGNW